MKRLKLVMMLAAPALLLSVVSVAQELPTTAQPGKCYVKCITPDEYRDITEVIVVKPEYKVLKTTPATYKTIEERVLVKEASKKYVLHPAVYETVSVTYESKAEETKLTVQPASFGNSSKTIQVQPKSGRWEYTQLADCPSANSEDCMVACYVEYPEVNETYPISVLNAAASTSKTVIPGKNATYTKQVIKTPARVEEIEIPAEYKIIKKTVVDKPAGVSETVVPAVTKTVTKRELVKKGGITTWEEVDCNLVGTANILPIYYELNSARLTPESERIIDEHLLKLMKDKPGLRIEIMSHTDSRGNDDYNLALSQQRAQSVVNYLVDHGISRNRLVAKGYGETRLKNKCGNGVDCTEDQHQQNRRTEFRIIQ
ncbi:OOP family OmpA-OmpF porin [Dysgonomonas sp. PFB1-18]|uniref:OmpA family protein n=1 Tax=unclassified Dysgonomonas TaxID=2630389 RepID=UPI0024754240|nr:MULTISPECIES: OmpA family protein [unclassified Dysgonomonas]MDL2303508.1 OmpA family protein [Dysgonomonas sp. OttesenSCG-928-D17]MDH6309858.1 OOP family OmpA-OmpF porin [Dysgonomonas sp. PF1-14]MDH6339402.1 OOP family OmpA-OmpF porin [Dysgonomonas sp. PF1-16]MDH6380901.1 OOP family OmpA-OmpF porin [Dysgonomonas sp. PFB1-18]MDH6397910.1 OOP family OmpA-OmpF porin [Dysgonomonas sp. PF1-23]